MTKVAIYRANNTTLQMSFANKLLNNGYILDKKAVYQGYGIPLSITCNHGHAIQASPCDLYQAEYRSLMLCGECKGTSERHTDAEVVQIIISNKYKCLDIYRVPDASGNNRRHVKIQCPMGHKRDVLWTQFDTSNTHNATKTFLGCRSCQRINRSACNGKSFLGFNLPIFDPNDLKRSKKDKLIFTCIANHHAIKSSREILERQNKVIQNKKQTTIIKQKLCRLCTLEAIEVAEQVQIIDRDMAYNVDNATKKIELKCMRDNCNKKINHIYSAIINLYFHYNKSLCDQH